MNFIDVVEYGDCGVWDFSYGARYCTCICAYGYDRLSRGSQRGWNVTSCYWWVRRGAVLCGATVSRLGQGMKCMNRLCGVWYLYRRDVRTSAWFAVRSATCMMVRGIWVQADLLFAELVLHMNHIAAGWDVDWFTDNASFQAFEE